MISNKNVATFIKEFKVQLPAGAHMDFIPGSYAQIKIPAFTMDYDKDIDKSLIGDEYLPEVRSLPVEVCQSGTDRTCLLYGQLPG